MDGIVYLPHAALEKDFKVNKVNSTTYMRNGLQNSLIYFHMYKIDKLFTLWMEWLMAAFKKV